MPPATRDALREHSLYPGPVYFAACHGGARGVPRVDFTLVYHRDDRGYDLIEMEPGYPIWFVSLNYHNGQKSYEWDAAGLYYQWGEGVEKTLLKAPRQRLAVFSYKAMHRSARARSC
jgi:hypothetical protein